MSIESELRSLLITEIKISDEEKWCEKALDILESEAEGVRMRLQELQDV